ncbi:MAG TPA: sialidase family protein [Ignavibacteriaceae bacterium]
MIIESIPTFDKYLSSHASTICSLNDKLLVAYFAGKYEGHRKNCIWISTKEGNEWDIPRVLFSGKSVLGREIPCWNPVFHSTKEKLYLYFKIGKSPSLWNGFFSESLDDGETWSKPKLLPAGIFGPMRSSPIRIDNYIVSGSSDEKYVSKMHFELSDDGYSWKKVVPICDPALGDCIQPAIIRLSQNKLIAYARSSIGVLVSTNSQDGGNSWEQVVKTEIPNPDSAIDLISVREDFHILVYNRSTKERTPLVMAISSDGVNWNDKIIIEDGKGEYSYPSITISKNGIEISYTSQRKCIKHALIETSELF